MTLKKFFSPIAAVLLILSAFWITGIDSVIRPGDEMEKNIRKYAETQQYIVSNYVEPVSITKLYKRSIKGLVAGLKDSSANLSGTPIDTTFSNVHIKNIIESITKFRDAYMYMEKAYPKADMTKRTANALRTMMNGLDPHSVYIEPKESELIASNFAGKFSGVGIMFNVIQDTITVITTISGGPSATLGIQSGDKIVAINDSTAIDFSNAEVRNTLRGPKGSKVDVTIKRPGREDALQFTITRDEIPLYTVDTAYMVDGKTGYIKINRFAATTHSEFMDAMTKLNGKGMERLVLDLRKNPGGYLGQAIAIASEFFPKGTVIVSTKSRHVRFTDSYYSRSDGKFLNIPLIILVNQGSASASEIVTGAVQDHDRGLVVGQRTFGKGLVQQQYQLVDSSNIRVTIAKYYTPSGRLIQKPYGSKNDLQYALEIYKRSENVFTDIKHYLTNVPDSLKHSTDAGRVVYGGGGIVPDHIIQPDTTINWTLANYMSQKRIGFEYIQQYLEAHPNFRSNWKGNFDGFRKEFSFTSNNLDDVLELIKQSGVMVSDTVATPMVKADTLYISPQFYQKSKRLLSGVMKAEMARQIWGLKKYYPVFNDEFKKDLEMAMTMWDEVKTLKKYASGHQQIGLEKERIK